MQSCPFPEQTPRGYPLHTTSDRLPSPHHLQCITLPFSTLHEVIHLHTLPRSLSLLPIIPDTQHNIITIRGENACSYFPSHRCVCCSRKEVMPDRSRPMSRYEPSSGQPISRKAVKFMTAGTIGAALLVLSGLTLTGTVIALVVATPVLVLSSPILVPAVIVVFLVTSGFFFSSGCGLAAIMVSLWIYNYVTGKHPPGADKLDYARGRISETAKDMKDRAKESGQNVRQKVQESSHAQTS
ncbi:PREDICTED: oleosin 1-like [Populus euphratica]|uniref:Oleosin 1-like n=1 Tax=Populus euphratica TaxID=75702 RepID=A0AAJ6XI63_POPEU|nr:PREDICTED: oleosin 1-like [Populus euphratica]